MMTDKKLTTVTLSQISEALEERQRPERRKGEKEIKIEKDRRKSERRASKKADK